MKTIAFATAMVLVGTLSAIAQNRFIPVRVINEALGITTPRPAYYLRASLTDATDAYFWAIGDYTNTRNNYDSLGFYSGVWRLRLAQNEWFAIDRLSGFPYAARWVEEAQCNSLYFADRDEETPLFLWGWTIRDTTKDTTKISPQELNGFLLTYNPDNVRRTWRPLWLPVPSNRYHSYYYALGTTQLPTTTPTVGVFSSSFMVYPDEGSPSGFAVNPWLDIYTGSVLNDSLQLQQSVGTGRDASGRLILPIVFNPAVGSDGAYYSIGLTPMASVNQYPPPVRPFSFFRYDPIAGVGQFLRPRTGITMLSSVEYGYVWSRDSSIYVLLAPQRTFTDDPDVFFERRYDTAGYVGVLRYDINTGHCERVLAIGSQQNGQVVSIIKGPSYTTPYKNGIATIGGEVVGDSFYTAIYILQHTAEGKLMLQQRIFLKDIFPNEVDAGITVRDYPYSLSAWGDRLVVTTYRGVYIIEPTQSSVPTRAGQNPMVYPLPARAGQVVSFTLPATEAAGMITSAYLYDGTGKNVPVSLQWSGTSVTLQTASLASGTYWFVVATDQGTRWIRPVVIE